MDPLRNKFMHIVQRLWEFTTIFSRQAAYHKITKCTAKKETCGKNKLLMV